VHGAPAAVFETKASARVRRAGNTTANLPCRMHKLCGMRWADGVPKHSGLRGATEHDRILEIAKAAAAIAALECAEDPYEFAQIQRSILTAMQQTFPEIFDFYATELC
jgi:hypothetical protein